MSGATVKLLSGSKLLVLSILIGAGLSAVALRALVSPASIARRAAVPAPARTAEQAEPSATALAEEASIASATRTVRASRTALADEHSSDRAASGDTHIAAHEPRERNATLEPATLPPAVCVRRPPARTSRSAAAERAPETDVREPSGAENRPEIARSVEVPDESIPLSASSSAERTSGLGPHDGPSIEEYDLVRRAAARIAREPSAALAILEQHARAHPDGILAQEREALAVEALAALGERAAAEQRAGRFLRRWPTAPLRERVLAALRDHDTNGDGSGAR